MPLEDQLTAIGTALNRIALAIERGGLPLTSATASSAKTETVEVDVPPPAPKKAKAAPPPPAAAPAEPAPAEPAPAPKADAEVTVNDLRELAQKLLQAGKVKEIVAINTKLGVRRISDAPKEKYAELHSELTKILTTPDDAAA